MANQEETHSGAEDIAQKQEYLLRHGPGQTEQWNIERAKHHIRTDFHNNVLRMKFRAIPQSLTLTISHNLKKI